MKPSHALFYGGFALGLSLTAGAAGATDASDNVGDNGAAVIRLADATDKPAWAAEATMNPDYKPSSSEPAAAPAAPGDAAPPAAGGTATTSYYGGQEPATNPAWAAEATMNPDYAPRPNSRSSEQKTAEPAAAAEVEAPPPATGGTATTSYFGGDESPKNPAWAAEAKMNTDSAPTSKSSAAAVPMTATVPATASDSAAKPAWAAEATMNPDYKKDEPAPAVSTAAASPAPDASVGQCQSSLTAEASAAKLTFGNGSAAINGTERSALDKVAAAAKNCGNVVIEVGGHTDNIGNAEANKALSEKRAEAVVSFLTKAGVDSSKLKAVGYGQEKPVSSNDTVEGRRANRRIEFTVTGQ